MSPSRPRRRFAVKKNQRGMTLGHVVMALAVMPSIDNIYDMDPMWTVETLVVVHVFQRETRKTPAAALELARQRAQEVT